MGSRDPMGIPPPAAVSIGSGSGSFVAMPQSGMGPPQVGSPSTGMPASLAPPPGLHAPAAMRPASVPLATVASNNSNSGPGISTAILPVPMPANTSMGMSIAMGVGLAQPVKRKRGRPRKYGPDGSMALALAPLASASPLSPSQKRGRGRPPGSGKIQQLNALGGWMAASAGFGFTPHVITIAAGEDVATKVMSFSQLGPRAICILSANGAISNVTLRQPAISGGTITYEGRFEILSLSGSFLLTETGGTRSRTGGLSISLAGPDGRVVGGGVAGLLVAASPVQLVVGSFLSNDRKSKPRPENVGASPNLPQGTRPTMNDASGVEPAVPDSPVNQNTGVATSSAAQQPVGESMATPIQAIGWPASQAVPEARRNTDINISLPGMAQSIWVRKTAGLVKPAKVGLCKLKAQLGDYFDESSKNVAAEFSPS